MTRPNAREQVSANKRRVNAALFGEAKAVGFTDKKGTVAYRRRPTKIDVFFVLYLPPEVCRKWGVPDGSFSLEPGCFFPYLPSLNSEKVCEDQSHITQPWEGLCQIRLRVHKSIRQPEAPPANIWWVGDRPEVADAVIEDVLRQVRSKVWPFYDRFDDPEAVLQALLEERDVLGSNDEGVWDMGQPGSWGRLFYIGYAALKCQKWDLALDAFTRCRDVERAAKWSHRSDIVACIERGLAEARRAVA
jgi:hypothetical protein